MTRAGLERQRWVDAIDDFVRQHGRATPRWAIFLTYEITFDALARSVLPVLSRRGRRFRSVVLTDQGTLEAALSVTNSKLPGAVNLHPVRCKRGGVFHPKLVFLRAGRHLRACFGSANITDGGLGTNLELWTQTESAEILAGLHAFLGEVIRSPDLALDDGARRSIRRALCGLPQRATPAVWSSFEESFARRLRGGPEKRAKRATIISPMYAGAGGIHAARKAIPAESVQLYTTANVPVSASTLLVYNPPHPADQAADDPEAFPRTLHAKAYVFHPTGRGETLAWMGSANFTAQALTKSVARGGNVELMVRTTLPSDEADALGSDLMIPHVPVEWDGSGAHASIDALLDDLLGRIRVPVQAADPDDEDADGNTDDGGEDDHDDARRVAHIRLDRQGACFDLGDDHAGPPAGITTRTGPPPSDPARTAAR